LATPWTTSKGFSLFPVSPFPELFVTQ
jgi:hypothetical protein